MNRRDFALGAMAMAVPGAAAEYRIGAASKYRIVDAQVHVWLNDPKYPWAAETKNPPKEDRTPAMLLELMKANGVERTVIAQYIGYLWDNRYALDSMKKYSPAFMGVCRLNPTDPSAPDQLSKLTEDGFHGVRISPAANASGDWINGPLMPPLWKRAEALKVPMQVYTPITRIPDLAHLIELCPDLTVVIDHMADCPVDQPEQLNKLIALAKYPRVFVKISHTWTVSHQAYPWLDAQEHVRRLHEVYGPQRLMWASDWPVDLGWTTYAQALSVVRDDMKFLNANDKSWILAGTVQRVWPFA